MIRKVSYQFSNFKVFLQFRFSFSECNCRENSWWLTSGWTHVCRNTIHTGLCKIAHIWEILSLPCVIFRLPSNFCQRQLRNDCSCYTYSLCRYHLAGVKLYFTCKLFFPRVYLSASRPSVCPIYHPAPSSKRTSKIFMYTDIGLRARSNRSHRTRECRRSINI